jgi:hypothetical protein
VDPCVGSGNDRPSRHLPVSESEDNELRQLMEGAAEAGSCVGGVDGRFLEKLDEAACCWRRAHLQTSAHSYR